jgi:hypothetical protein
VEVLGSELFRLYGPQTQISYSDLSTPDLVSPTDGIVFLNISGIKCTTKCNYNNRYMESVGTRVI